MAGYAAGNIVDFIRGFGERKKNAKVEEQLKNYLTKPDETIAAISQIDAPTAIGLQRQHVADQSAAQAAQDAGRKRGMDGLKLVTGFLKGVPAGGDYGAAFDSAAPFMQQQLGMTPEAIAQARGMILANPSIITSLDDEAFKASLDTKVVGPGSALMQGGKVAYRQPFAPQVKVVPDANGGNKVMVIDPNSQAPAAGFNTFYNDFLAPTEGGYAARDGKSGAPVNFGINQAANPDIDVKNLTQEQAAKLMHDRYWVPSGAEQIGDPKLQAIHADTAVNMGVGRAKLFLKESGGDPEKYMALRDAHYRRVGGPDLPTWLNRNKALAGYVNGTGGPGATVVAENKGSPYVRTATAEELKGYPAGTAGQVDTRTGKLTNVLAPPAAKVNLGKNSPEAVRRRAQAAYDQFERLELAAQSLLDSPTRAQATGTLDGLIPSIRQNSVDYDNDVKALKDQVAVGVLAAMKELSATGASGFGNLSNREGVRLENQFGSLNQRGEGSFERTLKAIIADAADKKAGIKAGLDSLGAGAPAADAAPAVSTVAGAPVKGQRKYNAAGAAVEWNGKGWAPVR